MTCNQLGICVGFPKGWKFHDVIVDTWMVPDGFKSTLDWVGAVSILCSKGATPVCGWQICSVTWIKYIRLSWPTFLKAKFIATLLLGIGKTANVIMSINFLSTFWFLLLLLFFSISCGNLWMGTFLTKLTACANCYYTFPTFLKQYLWTQLWSCPLFTQCL